MKNNKQAILVLSICGIFLFYKYIAQLFPSLISGVLSEQYGLSAVEIGILASSYYYSYSVMQILAGVILDKFSLRIPASLAVLIVAIAILIFSATENFAYICISRALMGVGCAFATSLYLKCAASWTSDKTFAFISSLLATATMLGAACGAAPVSLLFETTGWHKGLIYIGYAGLILGVLAFIFIKTRHNVKESIVRPEINIKSVIMNRNNFWLLLYSGLTFSPIVILGGLWGIPFLQLKLQSSASMSATLISIMFIGHAIGSPVWALLSSKLKNYNKELMFIANIAAFLCLILIIYAPLFSFMTYDILFFLFGFSVGCFMLSFEMCRLVNGFWVMGFATAYINSGEGIVGSIIEPLIGLLLDVFRVTNAYNYTLLNYQYSLILLPLCYVLSSIVIRKLPDASVKTLEENERSLARI